MACNPSREIVKPTADSNAMGFFENGTRNISLARLRFPPYLLGYSAWPGSAFNIDS